LKEVDLFMGSHYRIGSNYDYEDKDIELLRSGDRNRLLNALIEAKTRKKIVKFSSLVHGSKSGSPNTTMYSDGTIRCWRCSITISFVNYIGYVRDNLINASKQCAQVGNYREDQVVRKFIKSLKEFPIETNKGVVKILKARAGSGKTTCILRSVLKAFSVPCLILAPGVKDCESIAGIDPSIVRQFGPAETRSSEITSNVMVMTYSSFANRWYNETVNNFIEEVRRIGLLVIDEIDRLMDEFIGGQDAFYRVFNGKERWNIIGMSATPDKLIGAFNDLSNKSFKVQMYELIDPEERKHHLKNIKVVGQSGNFKGHIGPKGVEELLNKLKPRFPKGTHLSLYGNLSGIVTREPFVDNVIYSQANESIDRKKLLKLEGSNIVIRSKGKELEITAISEVGSRTLSIHAEGFKNYLSAYVGIINPDTLHQHFKRNRNHIGTENNPDLNLIASFVREEELKRWGSRIGIRKEVYENIDKLGLPEILSNKVRENYLKSINGAMLSKCKIEYILKEQNKITFDEEIILTSKEEFKQPTHYEDFLTGRRLIEMSFKENDLIAQCVLCILTHKVEKLVVSLNC
jgi:hypothetical protein